MVEGNLLGASELLQVVRELNEWADNLDYAEIGFWVETNGENWTIKARAADAEFDLFMDEDTSLFILDNERWLLDDPAVLRRAILRSTEKRLVDAAEQLKILQAACPLGGW